MAVPSSFHGHFAVKTSLGVGNDNQDVHECHVKGCGTWNPIATMIPERFKTIH
jgi:hypothetical protein